MSHRDDWKKATAALKRPRPSRAAAEPENLELDLPLPASGDPVEVADMPTLRMAEAARPAPVVRTLEGQCLRDFQSSLTNTVTEREQTSNLLHFWERIPRYHCGDIQGVDSSTDPKELGVARYTFEDNGERYIVEITPAHIVQKKDGVEQHLFCYPDSTDELVELALIKLAMDGGDILRAAGGKTGKEGLAGKVPSYGVHFTINQLMDLLRSWNRSRTYAAVRRSLDVLHRCNVKIESGAAGGGGVSATILPELISYKQNGFRHNDRNGYWTAQFHPIVSLGIHAGLYQQYNLQRTASLRSSVSLAVAKLVVLEGRNISTSTPFTLAFSRFRETTGMLHYKRLSQALKKFRDDIESLIGEGMLSRVEFHEVKRGKRVIDIEARLYASDSLVKEMKASHRRASIIQMRRQARAQLAQKSASPPA